MKRLNKLKVDAIAKEKREVSINELIKVSPSTYRKRASLADGDTHNIDIDIVSVSKEGELLKVIVNAKKDGMDVFVDNPLYYYNPPICVPDGTYEDTIIDGVQQRVPNYVEDPEEALKTIILDTLRVTSLKR